MAHSDAPHSAIRFPHAWPDGLAGGPRTGRACRPGGVSRGGVMPGCRAVAAVGSEVVLRFAGPGDLGAVRALHRRCTPRTLGLRYQGPAGEADSYLGHLLDPRHGQALVAEVPSGALVALGHLLWDGDEAEVALLVTDAWQRRGVGSALLRWLLELAAQAGQASVYAVMRASNAGMIAAMRGTGLPLDRHAADGTLVLTIRLSPQPVNATVLPAGTSGG